MIQQDGSTTPPTTTFDSGVPAPTEDWSLTAGPDGPIVLHDANIVAHAGEGVSPTMQRRAVECCTIEGPDRRWLGHPSHP